MKAFTPVLLLLCGLLTGRAAVPLPDEAAQDHEPLSILLLVDTSLGMAPLRDHVAQRAYELIASGFQGQLTDGDQILVWPFNETVHREGLDPKTWTAARKEFVAEEIFLFLNDLTFERTQRLDQALIALYDLASTHRYTTGLIFSNGDTQIVGSPFDLYINAIYRSRRRAALRDQAPIITLLAFESSIINQWAVFTHNGVIGLPTLPRPKVAPPPELAAHEVSKTELLPQPQLPKHVPHTPPASPLNSNSAASNLTTNTPPESQLKSTAEDPGLASEHNQTAAISEPASPPARAARLPIKSDIEAPDPAVQNSSPPPVMPQQALAAPKLEEAATSSSSTMVSNVAPAKTGQNEAAPAPSPTAKTPPSPPTDSPALQPTPEQASQPAHNQETARSNRLIIFLILALVAVGGLVLMMIRGNKPSKPSLISQYYDRPR